MTVNALCTYTSIWPSIPTLRTSFHEFPCRAHLSSCYQPFCVQRLCSQNRSRRKQGWGEGALPHLLSMWARRADTRLLPIQILSSLVFFSFSPLPCNPVALTQTGESLLDSEEARKRSQLQRRSFSERQMAFHIPWGTVSKQPVQIWLRNKHESPTRHQSQSQQKVVGRHHNTSHRSRE